MGDWQPTLLALTFGLLAIPISYVYTLLCKDLSPAAMLGFAGAIMTSVLAITVMLTKDRVKNKMYYGFAMFVFSGIIDILSGLEMDGVVKGFLTLYLKHGEPYLVSAWGAMASYWDGTVFLSFYLTMAYLASNGCSFRTVGLHWSSGILNSMIVLLLGAYLSKSGMSWCTVLNIPYVVFPLVVLVYCLGQHTTHPPQLHAKSAWIDKLLVVLLIEAALAALVKGLATFNVNQHIPYWYRTIAEPMVQEEDPAPFAGIQGLITLFYFLPSYLALAWGITINPTQKWVQDLAIILAGASLQAGGCTVGMAFHQLTRTENQLPSIVDHSANAAFWGVNLLLSIVPQVVVIRLLFLPVKSTREARHEKQKNKKRDTKHIKEN